jgi:hypothetical protein
MNQLKLGIGIILVGIGALMIVDSVITVATGGHLLLPINPGFKIIIAVIALAASAPQIEEARA